MTPIIELNEGTAQQLCDGFGWLSADQAHVLCLQADGSVERGRVGRPLHPYAASGTASEPHLARVVGKDLLLIRPVGEHHELLWTHKGRSPTAFAEVQTDSRPLDVEAGDRCVSWLAPTGAENVLWVASRGRAPESWGTGSWDRIETVDCDRSVIVRDVATFYRVEPNQRVENLGEGERRYDGAWFATVSVARGTLTLSAGADEVSIALPPHPWDDGYTTVETLSAAARGGVLVQAHPGVVFALALHNGRVAGDWFEVHFAPGPQVPVEVYAARRGGVCVVWASHDGPLETTLWTSCASGME